MRDARLFKQVQAMPWPVLVDDLEGTVHQVYGGLANPSYLIGADGYVAFYNMVTHAPTLDMAMNQLLQQDGRGIVLNGIDRIPHLGAALANGWPGLRRGLPQSYLDLELAAPGTGVGLWLGYQIRGLLKPFFIRSKPLPQETRALLWGGLALLAILVLGRKRKA